MSAPPNPRSGREGVLVQASPLLIGSSIAAVGSTVLLAVLWFFDARTPPPVSSGNGRPPPPPPDGITIHVVIGLCIMTWLAVLVAIARDQVVRLINRNTLEILAATREYGEHRETEGYLLARRAEGLAQPGAGGDVLPFPRQTSPPAHD